jgi:hypothetical protein
MAYTAGSAWQQSVDHDSYLEQLRAYADAREHGYYPPTILIGLGGTGAKALQHLRRMLLERLGTVDLPGVAFLSIDTDTASVRPAATEREGTHPYDELIAFRTEERLDVKANFSSILENMAQHPHIREWWDDSIPITKSFNLEKGAGQLRPLSRLVFFENRREIQAALKRCWARVTAQDLDSKRVDVSSAVRVVMVAGWAGGTGSGMFLDMAALLKHTFTAKPIERHGIFVTPGVFRGVDSAFPKLAANGFAALRELNHYLSQPFEVQWDHQTQVSVRGLFDRYVLVTGTNCLGQSMAQDSDAYRAIGETLFLDFAGGPLKSWVEGVRINREQYLKSFVSYSYRIDTPDGRTQETHADEWKTAFSSFGIAKIVYPSWRLLNYAKYDLAAQMVQLLDPGKAHSIADVITEWRNRFMREAGFFQGEWTDEQEQHRRFWQIRDALARQSGTNQDVQNVYDHIAELAREWEADGESMFAEKTTMEDGRAAMRRIGKLFGDPYSPGNEGDWALQILENRKALVRDVTKALNDVIESFQAKRGIGPSGVRQILENVLEELERPHDRAYYTDWFRHRRAVEEKNAEEARLDWEKRVKIADQASRGFLRSSDNHKAALEEAAKCLVAHWRARVNEYICAEGAQALEGIAKALRDQLTRLDAVLDKMSSLESHYLRCRSHFEKPIESTLFIELPVHEDYAKLLQPYLGINADARAEKLQRLLERGLRKMGIDTLAKLETAMSGKLDQFRENLAAQAFFALKGDEGGRTVAFVDDGEEPQQGFLERYSVLNALKAMPASERRGYLEQLYRLGLPWVTEAQDDPTNGIARPVADAFLGIQPRADAPFAEELTEQISSMEQRGFSPIQVQIADPSELVFYTEWSAFAGYFANESGQLRGDYRRLLFDRVKPQALHLHQDYHQFPRIIPFTEPEVRDYKVAWKRFHQAQMLGILCSRHRRRGDDKRVTFSYRKRTTSLDTTWDEVGVEATVLRSLMTDRQFGAQIARDIEERIQELLQSGGCYADLLALADYYYYCVYPNTNEDVQSGAVAVQARGSMQNLVLHELRREWRQLAIEKGMGAERIDAHRATRLESLVEWTVPIARTKGLPVPMADDVPTELRVEEWALLEPARRAVRRFVEAGWIKQARDGYGDVAAEYPRLAVNWTFFRPPSDQPERLSTATTYWYKGPSGSHSGVSFEQIAGWVQADPSARHRVFGRGWKAWLDAAEVPEIAAMLAPADEPPPLEEPPSVEEAVEYHYARDGERLGKRSAEQIAEAIANARGAEHKVWTKAFGRAWKLALDVPEIAALVPPADEPPLLDDEPPPLDDDEPPPL